MLLDADAYGLRAPTVSARGTRRGHGRISPTTSPPGADAFRSRRRAILSPPGAGSSARRRPRLPARRREIDRPHGC